MWAGTGAGAGRRATGAATGRGRCAVGAGDAEGAAAVAGAKAGRASLRAGDSRQGAGQFEVLGPPLPLFGALGIGTGLYVKDPDGNTVELRTYP